MMPKNYGGLIPAAPFVNWIRHELARLEANETLRQQDGQARVRAILADRLGVSVRVLYRYEHAIVENGHSYRRRPTCTFRRNRVEDLLHAAGVPFGDVYPDIAAAEDVDLEPDEWCEECHDVVTPVGGECLWCGTVLPERFGSAA